jgi:hypothetical protein
VTTSLERSHALQARLPLKSRKSNVCNSLTLSKYCLNFSYIFTEPTAVFRLTRVDQSSPAQLTAIVNFQSNSDDENQPKLRSAIRQFLSLTKFTQRLLCEIAFQSRSIQSYNYNSLLTKVVTKNKYSG